jgi:hypothetical protein
MEKAENLIHIDEPTESPNLRSLCFSLSKCQLEAEDMALRHQGDRAAVPSARPGPSRKSRSAGIFYCTQQHEPPDAIFKWGRTP